MAAYGDNVEAVTFLVDKGAEVNIQVEDGVNTSIDNIRERSSVLYLGMATENLNLP